MALPVKRCVCGEETAELCGRDGCDVPVCKDCVEDHDRECDVDDDYARDDDYDPLACPGCGGSCQRACR